MLIAFFDIVLELVDAKKKVKTHKGLLVRDFAKVLVLVLVRALVGRWRFEFENGLVTVVCHIVLLL
jgi:hypothetical protein